MAIFNFTKNILLEAEKETIEVEETDDVDYAEDVENDTPEEAKTTEDDEEQPDDDDTTQDEEPTETDEETDDTTDYTEDVSDEETEDDTTGDEQPTDDTSEEQPTEETPSEDNIKNASLLKDIIDLYYEVINIINKIDGFVNMNHKVNQICVQAKNNLTTLNEYLYDFIRGPFKTNTYVKNMYIYQYALEIVKINIEMFRNIEDFNSI